MTDEELSAIEALANAATPLVWQADKPMEDGYPCPMCDGEGDLTFTTTEAGGTCAAGVQVFGIGKDLEAMRKFHELALTNTQALIAEVRRLKAIIGLVAKSQREPWDKALFNEACEAVEKNAV